MARNGFGRHITRRLLCVGASNAYRYYRRHRDVKFACHIDLMGIGDTDVDEFAMPANGKCRRHSLSHGHANQTLPQHIKDVMHNGCRAPVERLMMVVERTPAAQVSLALPDRLMPFKYSLRSAIDRDLRRTGPGGGHANGRSKALNGMLHTSSSY